MKGKPNRATRRLHVVPTRLKILSVLLDFLLGLATPSSLNYWLATPIDNFLRFTTSKLTSSYPHYYTSSMTFPGF